MAECDFDQRQMPAQMTVEEAIRKNPPTGHGSAPFVLRSMMPRAFGERYHGLYDAARRKSMRLTPTKIGEEAMEAALERQTMSKVYLRLLPFCFILYFICYLDRVNIGFAALTMNKDIGLSAYVFGLGAGAFFWGYFLLEVPSNLILDKVGARRWIGRIMISWGLVSGAFAFTQGPISFFILRFSLGLAEAGFFPGMILYFTYWFPPLHRARIVAGL